MKNKKDRQAAQKRYYDTKSLMMRYVKRYGIVMIIATVISVIFCYIMSEEVAGFTSVEAVLSTLAIVLASLFVGIFVYNKIDEKEEERSDSENTRDPFSD
ncbi:MAG: hypothetical protein EOM55_00905 [Clostridia bacterium]|nr:hypothetical protein [Clostridia bacterium]